MKKLVLWILWLHTVLSLRHWEIQRENGNKELCCFCTNFDLIHRNHRIKECEEKFDSSEFKGYVGSPVCSCFSSNKYPSCPEKVDVCGKTIHCQNTTVYEKCQIRELLPTKIMTCNDSLQWEHDMICQETCQPSYTIDQGRAVCVKFKNQIICRVMCNEGFYPKEKTELSCSEAKTITCKKQTFNLITRREIILAIFIGIVVVVAAAAVVVGWKIYNRRIRNSNGNNNVEMMPLNPSIESNANNPNETRPQNAMNESNADNLSEAGPQNAMDDANTDNPSETEPQNAMGESNADNLSEAGPQNAMDEDETHPKTFLEKISSEEMNFSSPANESNTDNSNEMGLQNPTDEANADNLSKVEPQNAMGDNMDYLYNSGPAALPLPSNAVSLGELNIDNPRKSIIVSISIPETAGPKLDGPIV